jgi:arylsulfatase A-like enzyme
MIWSDAAPAAPGRAVRRPRAIRPAILAAVAAAAGAGALLLLAACAGRGPEGFALRPLVEAGRFAVGGAGAGAESGGGAAAGLRFPARPALAEVEIDHESRPVVLTTGAPWSWTGRVPARAELHASLQLVPAAWRWVHRLQAVATLRAGRDREVLQVARASEGAGPVWLDLSADLGRWAGRRATLELSATLPGLPARLRGANLVAWGPVALTGPGGERRPAAAAAAAAGRPNILLILVDTLRRDRLTPYGYRRETSPEIARRLAAPGTVMEDAYSQAPWTLPSVVSLMTGRYPGELLGGDLAAYGIPPDVEPLAERLAAAGYETAGFLANPTMHVGAGFERGFRTFYAPPADPEWLRRHADDLNRHAQPWITAYQDRDRPFFLYLHYIDPHDPYDNPETAGNHSPFEGEYRGPVGGDWVHGIYSGKLALADPVRDLAHLSALYDSEVHYVDRAIGELLDRLRPEVLARTLVLLTADHGEELLDHGGWKHGQTLYEEQIHVPLIWRWDGHIRAGRRLAGTVRLLDLAPTLAAAAGAAPDPRWQGMDLLPALTGAAPLAERPAFAEGLSGGPLRAAAVLGRQKLIVFNREEPFAPANELQDYLWRKDLARLARVELYGLARDPAEGRDLAPDPAAPAGSRGRIAPAAALDPPGPGAGGRLPLLAAVMERRLDLCLPGLKLLASGVPAGSRLRVELTLARPPRRWTPYLLAAADRVRLDGARLTLELAGGSGGGADALARGVRIEGDFAAAAEAVVQALSAAVDGRPLPAARLRVGAGSPYTGGPLPRAALATRQWPGAPAAGGGDGGPAVQLWMHDAAGEPERRDVHDVETERRLRALGYIE